jgi:hypothetical protein
VQATPSRRPGTATAAVPAQHAPAGDGAQGAPAVPGPRPASGLLPAQLLPGSRAGLGRSRPAPPDTVVFTASCPACGLDCEWTEEREDTRLRAVVRCPCG